MCDHIESAVKNLTGAGGRSGQHVSVRQQWADV